MNGAIAKFARRGLALMPQRAVWAAESRTLWVADLHLGKASAFRNLGQPAPEGGDEETLCRLAGLVDALNARRMIVLGDFVHARAGQTAALHNLLRRWTGARPQVECLVIRGNHDLGAGDAPSDCGFGSVDEPFAASGVEGRHHPIERDRAVDDGPIVLAGHLHPVARLSGLARDSVRLACFAIMGRQIVLPAFGEFTGGWLVRPGEDWKVLITTD
jgi:DNA ligase-associated metallophosphoesterase